MQASSSLQKPFLFLLIGLISLGIFSRFYHIRENTFVYYDEGLYLSENLQFVTLIENFPPHSLSELLSILKASLGRALGTGKAIWFFLSDLRGFGLGAKAYYFPRVLAAIFGTLTLGGVFLFARKYYSSKTVPVIATAMLALLPSHIYYSRLTMQETFSAFCFLLGMYWYVSNEKLNWKVFLSAVFFGATFFSNYRMIVIPALTLFAEIWSAWANRYKPDIQKYVWHTVAFFAQVFVIGNLFHGENTYVVFAWMFHQTQLAEGKFEWLNLLSYPYYTFKLESVFFGLLFWGNIYYVIKRKWDRLFPFMLVVVLMSVFSLPQDKAVRYLCVAMPFMAMAAGFVLNDLFENLNGKFWRWALVGFSIVLVTWHILKADTIMQFRNDYETSMEELSTESHGAKILSSQPFVQKLFVSDSSKVEALPKNPTALINAYRQGYQYLIIDPQAYVSYAEEDKRFFPQLVGYLQFITQAVPPKKVYPHFNAALLERFVFEHNENLRRSLAFLSSAKKGRFSSLYVYDIDRCIVAMSHALRRAAERGGENGN